MTEPQGPTFPRQTASFVRERMAQFGLHPEVRYGQNFLIDLNLLELIVEAAQLAPSDLVLEVGTGTAGLTTRLAQRAGHVVTVEIDAQLAELARSNLGPTDRVTLICRDVLKNKHTLAPEVMEAIARQMESLRLPRYKLVANLPYNIATPLISNLLASDRRPSLMVVTVQKEVADRMLASPGTKDYGALSVWVQSLATVEMIRVLPPTVFWPRPKVDSAIVRIALQESWREKFVDLAFFHTMVRALFFHRRKFLRKVVISATKDRLDKPTIDRLLDQLELPVTARTEELPVPKIQQLVETLRLALAGDTGHPANYDLADGD
ncbi:MAG: 16S rRNA (adenine(1518)-N(6)/adenine(1519)-N(6))-dimethyltransferase RsmA [Pirellulales bacterium]